MDLLGTRRGYAIMITWWSAANFVHGLVSSFFGLAVCRFLLGLGEGGGFPGSRESRFGIVPCEGTLVCVWHL